MRTTLKNATARMIQGAAAGLVAASLLSVASTGDAASSSISVPIGGLRNDQGQVGCLLFASADGFPSNPSKAVGRKSVPIAQRSATCVFDDVAPGNYAVAAIHDENGNGKLDKNFLGIPTEGYGASRDARGTMGPPKWEDAVFPFPGGALEMKVVIHY